MARFDSPRQLSVRHRRTTPWVDAPIQPFAALLGSSPNGNPEGIDRITGMLLLDGQLIVNAEALYDAAGDNDDTSLLVRDASSLGGVVDGYFELGFRQKINNVFRAAIEFGVPLLPSESFDLGHRQTLHADLGECLPGVVQFDWPNYCRYEFHFIASPVVLRENATLNSQTLRDTNPTHSLCQVLLYRL